MFFLKGDWAEHLNRIPTDISVSVDKIRVNRDWRDGPVGKYLSCKWEGRSSEAQPPRKCRVGTLACLESQHSEDEDRVPGASWLVRPTASVSSGFKGESEVNLMETAEGDSEHQPWACTHKGVPHIRAYAHAKVHPQPDAVVSTLNK